MCVRRQMGRRPRRLGEPVKLHEIATERRLRLPQNILGNWRCAIKDLPDRCHIRCLDRRLLQQKQNDRRHDEGNGDFLGFDETQNMRRIDIQIRQGSPAFQSAQPESSLPSKIPM